MKLSFMTFACPDLNFRQVVEAAVRHEYHGIEFRCDANHAHGVEVWSTPGERRDMRRMLSDRGLEPCCLATSLQFATDRVLDEAPARLELAADLGCPALRVFCGPPPGSAQSPEAAAAPEPFSPERLIELVAQQLRRVADLADPYGLELWLETHDTMSRAALAAAAVRAAGHPAVGINYDNMHPFRKGEPLPETFAALGNLIRHTHFHDALNQPDKVVITPMGKGEMPLDDMFAGLLAAGFDGYLSGEWFGKQYGPDLDASLETYRRDLLALLDRHRLRLQ